MDIFYNRLIDPVCQHSALPCHCCALPFCVGENIEQQTTIHIHMNSPIPQMHVFGLWEETRAHGENQEPSCWEVTLLTTPPPYGTM